MSNLTQRILKTMTLFGSVEAVTMLCSVVRNKIMALWVGAIGVGLLGLYAVALEMLSTLAQMGLRMSAVKSISASTSEKEVSEKVVMVRRIGFVLGVCGALLTMIFAPFLSYMSFGDYSHGWQFVALSIGVFFTTIVASESAVLQGRNQLSRIAKASAYSAPLSLCVAIAMIYYWRIDSAIPVLLAYAVIMAGCYFVFRSPMGQVVDSLSWRNTITEARPMLVLGVIITITGFSTWLSSYVVLSFVNHCGGEEQMGLYQAGFTVAIRYMGVIFTSLGMEYFPRISSAAVGGMKRLQIMMRHQLKVVLCVVTPMAIGLVLLASCVVNLLYSGEFLKAVPLVVLAMPGVVLRAVSFCMAFVIYAKGDGRVILVTELLSCVLCILLNCAGYYLWGLAGVGVSFSVWYALYAIIVGVAVRRTYGITLGRNIVWFTISLTLLTGIVSVAGFIYL